MIEITYDELKALPEGSYELIDIRDEGLTAYGMIPGAIHIFVDELENSEELAGIPLEKKIVFYCEIGRRSREIDDTLPCFEGRKCYSLTEGYVGFVRSRIRNEGDREEYDRIRLMPISRQLQYELVSLLKFKTKDELKVIADWLGKRIAAL